MSAYTPTGTIAFLQNYNAWRRGDETLEMPHPAEIGANIQEAIVLLRKYDSLLTEGDQLRAEIELDEQLQAATEASLKTLTAERDQLRAEVERLRAGIEECLHTNAHLADGEDCTLIGLKRCLRDSRVERSDAEQVDALASWANTCMHHNDAERGRCWRVCPVCITAERDQLRVDVELADVMYQRECEVEHELRAKVERLRSDRDCEKRLRKDADEFRENAIERAMKAEADAYTYLQRANSFRKLSDEAEAECLEQARLLGKSAEREADLRGKVERLERALLTNGSEKSEIKFFDEL